MPKYLVQKAPQGAFSGESYRYLFIRLFCVKTTRILQLQTVPKSLYFYRQIANMATISPKRGFSVATVARVWLPVLIFAVAGKTAASQASFPLNSTKISHFSSLKEVSIWYVRFEYCFSESFVAIAIH